MQRWIAIIALESIKDTLRELVADPQIDFGPAYAMTEERKELALRQIQQVIDAIKKHDLT